ncbi:MAG: hypothetical protein A4C66_07275 [Nitrospira sp. HN-bin3]|uniref:hypothetical protein n=1 Tax=Nitrospira cf. moscoviensis SBR1015 TaxID=96242 RepID=UPI000A0C74D8|nr:hypothetical protein [Nitrospira cf. moscoviensis SBR1015]OQW45184.1 MAG: hypothetical protein A4C66_07275 [Nitrospira sp. HN-bin3]
MMLSTVRVIILGCLLLSAGCGLLAIPLQNALMSPPEVLEHTITPAPGVTWDEVKNSKVSAVVLGYKQTGWGEPGQMDIGRTFGDYAVQEYKEKGYTSVSEGDILNYLKDHKDELAGMGDKDKIAQAARTLGADNIVFGQFEGEGIKLSRVTLLYFSSKDWRPLAVHQIAFSQFQSIKDAAHLMATSRVKRK